MRDIGVDRKIPTGEKFSQDREYTRPEEIKILQKYLKAGIQALADATELESETSNENKLIDSGISSLNDSRIDLPGELQTQLDNSVTDLPGVKETGLDSRVENISETEAKGLDSSQVKITDTSKGESDLIENPGVIRLELPGKELTLDKSVLEIKDKEDIRLSEGSERIKNEARPELDKSISEISGKNIEKLSDEVSEISEKPLTALDKILEKLQGKNTSDLDNRVTEISDKREVSLDSSQMKIKIAGVSKLSDDSEKLTSGKNPELDKSVEEIKDSIEVSLTDEAEVLQSDVKTELDSSIEELQDKTDISLSDGSEEIKDERSIKLSEESEIIPENKISGLNEDREEIKNLEGINLNTEKETIDYDEVKELPDLTVQISDSKETKLNEDIDKLKTPDQKLELDTSKEKLENDLKSIGLSENLQELTVKDEPELNNSITELSDYTQTDLNNSTETISPQDISELNSSREDLENIIKTELLNDSREEFSDESEIDLNNSRENLDDPNLETDGNGNVISSTIELDKSREEFSDETEINLNNSRENLDDPNLETDGSGNIISSTIELDRSRENLDDPNLETDEDGNIISSTIGLDNSREEFKDESEVNLDNSKEDLSNTDKKRESSLESGVGISQDQVSQKIRSQQISKENKIDIKKSENSKQHSNLQASRLVEAEVKVSQPNESIDVDKIREDSTKPGLSKEVNLDSSSSLPTGFGVEIDSSGERHVTSLHRPDSVSGKPGTNEPGKLRNESDREGLSNTDKKRESSLESGVGISQDQVSQKIRSQQISKENKIDIKKSEDSKQHSNLQATRLVESEVKKNTPNEKLDDPNYTKASGYKIRLDSSSSLPTGFGVETDSSGERHVTSLHRPDSVSGKPGTNEPDELRNESDREGLSNTDKKRESSLESGVGISQDQVSQKIRSQQISKENKIDIKKSEDSKQHSNLQATRLVESEVKKNTPNEKLDDPNYTKASGYKVRLDKNKSEIDKAGAPHPVSSKGPSQTQIDAVKLYLGLTTSEGASYEKAASILDNCGDWGKKVIAQLTGLMVQEKGKKPYELIDPAKVQAFYDSVKNTYSTDNPDADEVFGLKKEIEKTIKDDTFYLNRGKGKNAGIAKYRSPDSANSVLELINNPSAGIRALVELAVNALNAKGKTKQLLLDEAVGLAVLARDEAQKLVGADPSRLPERAGLINGALQTFASGKGLVNTALSAVSNHFNSVKEKPLNRPYAYVKGQKVEGVNKLGGDTTWESLEEPKVRRIGIVADKSLDGLFLTKFKDKNSGTGFDTTLSELVISGSNSSESELYKSNYEKFISGLKQSPYITTSSSLINWQQSDRDMLTLDSNHVWEIRLFPYTGPENGNLSFLPTFSQLNYDNKINFGYKTRWNGWIPFSGFEFQQAKLTGKSTSLFDGEINYPISIEFTNELRLSLSDDSFKSWKRYFEACSEAATFYCTRSYQSVEYQTMDYVNTDLTSYIERGVLCPKNYKNITFRCIIYIMNPQYYTVKKLDLLVVLKDFLVDWQGENDASSTELSLTFSVVGESPVAEVIQVPTYTPLEVKKEKRGDWGSIISGKLSQIIGVL